MQSNVKLINPPKNNSKVFYRH